MQIAAIIDANAAAKDVLLAFGLPCFRCVVAEHETLEEGLRPHRIDASVVLDRLNRDAPMPAKAAKRPDRQKGGPSPADDESR